MQTGSESGAQSETLPLSRTSIFLIVAGVLLAVGFATSFGYRPHQNVLVGSESFSGSEFAASRPSQIVEWFREDDGIFGNSATSPPNFVFVYLLPVAGVALGGLGISVRQKSTFRAGTAALWVGGVSLALLLFAWWRFIAYFGSDDMIPGIGSYLCAVGCGLAIWQGLNIRLHEAPPPRVKEGHRALEAVDHPNATVPGFPRLATYRKVVSASLLVAGIGTILIPWITYGSVVDMNLVLTSIPHAVTVVGFGLLFSLSACIPSRARIPVAGGLGATFWALDYGTRALVYSFSRPEWSFLLRELTFFVTVFILTAYLGVRFGPKWINDGKDGGWLVDRTSLLKGLLALVVGITVALAIAIAAESPSHIPPDTLQWAVRLMATQWGVGLAFAAIVSLRIDTLLPVDSTQPND